ncbi:MAG: hypothetical protein GVY18_01240 [Bacteroidetes bacterium]|jgi:hypothetical protein|nr:hypothetical protein [Bacteroidota bacterium]
MSRARIGALGLLLLTLLALDAQAQAITGTLRVNQILREEPDGRLTTTMLEKGEAITAEPIPDAEGWYAIYTHEGSTSTLRGYLLNPMIQRTGTPTTTASLGREGRDAPARPARVRYIQRAANVRAEPSTSSVVLAHLAAGDEVGVYRYEDGWALVDLAEVTSLTETGRQLTARLGFVSGELVGRAPPADSTANAPLDSAPADSTDTVYLTRTGSKYHRATCRHLRRSKIPTDLEAALATGYEPCRVCRPPTKAKE